MQTVNILGKTLKPAGKVHWFLDTTQNSAVCAKAAAIYCDMQILYMAIDNTLYCIGGIWFAVLQYGHLMGLFFKRNQFGHF